MDRYNFKYGSVSDMNVQRFEMLMWVYQICLFILI
jgi:hypothetical protein